MLPVSARLAMLFVTLIAYMATPAAAAIAPTFDSATFVPFSVVSHVKIDSKGAVHVLWSMPSSFGPDAGVWYSKYEANGTTSILPRQLRNSTLVQAADMDLDSAGFPHIAWTELSAVGNITQGSPQVESKSTLYYAELNTTNLEGFAPRVLNAGAGFVIWPSLAVDGNSTTHLVWTEVELGAQTSVYYASLSSNRTLSAPTLIAAYNGSLVSFPRPHVALDQFSGVHIAWVESNQLSDGQVVSSVTYAKFDLKAKNLTRRDLGKFGIQIPDLTMAVGSSGSVFVVWQLGGLSVTDERLYVSRISRDTRVAYLRQLDEPSPQSLSNSLQLSVSPDSQDNLYVVWYTPPAFRTRVQPEINSTFSSISYLKMEFDGSISQTGNQVIPGLLAFTISGSGDLYAISEEGIVKVTSPTGLASILLVGAVVIVGASSVGGAIAVEDTRYRILRRLTPLARYAAGSKRTMSEKEMIVRMLSRKPGLRLKEMRDLLHERKATMFKLAELEKLGAISSVRIGISRKFYVNLFQESVGYEKPVAGAAPIASQVLHEISSDPGIWEAKIAQRLGLSQQLVHYHLRKLRAAGMISTESMGKRKLYRLPSAPREN